MNKILFIIGSLNRGGAERVVSILANHYAKKNWHVGICVLLDNKIGYELESVIKIFDLCSDPIKLDLVIRVVIYCPDIFMPRNACAYTV